jgi:fucose permease
MIGMVLCVVGVVVMMAAERLCVFYAGLVLFIFGMAIGTVQAA